MGARTLPGEVLEAARFCIADWYGVALGALGLQPVGAIARTVRGWGTRGECPVLAGGTAAAPAAALVNGTMAHCLDFDDTHVGSISHLSGPTWAAAFAAAMDAGVDPQRAVRGFIAGFEVGARVGGGGFGVATNERHTHATGVFGCLAAAAAAASVYGLGREQTQAALAIAATQVGGLTGSFGTPAKPFHAGKAAFNGLLAAQMAREGYTGAADMLEPGGGLDRALVQDKRTTVPELDFDEGWEITRNTFKPYASCLLTHPVIDAGKVLGPQVDMAAVETIRVIVHPLAIQLAGKQAPSTAYEGKFSLAYTTALSLLGRNATQGDFTDAGVNDARMQALVRKVQLVPTPEMALTAATLELQLRDGTKRQAHTPLALGNPGRPMGWDDMRGKFVSLTQPALGEASAGWLFSQLQRVDERHWNELNGPLKAVEPA
jgi:2-methylcitrate dehydratase PrpD